MPVPDGQCCRNDGAARMGEREGMRVISFISMGQHAVGQGCGRG